MKTCLNWGKAVENKYCSACGQRSDTGRLSWKNLWEEIVRGLLQLDRGFFYTAFELFLRPGRTIRQYLHGKRVQHFKPFALLFLTSTIYGLLVHFLELSTFLGDITEGFMEGATDGESDGESTQQLGNTLLWLRDHYAWATVILLPVLVFTSRFAFGKSEYSILEHSVINAYYTGLKSSVYILLLPLAWWMNKNGLMDYYQLSILGLTALLFGRTYFLVFNMYSIPIRILRMLYAFVLYLFGLIILSIAIAFVGGLLMGMLLRS